ncbi:MAG: starch-binding protein [Eubacteriales bacterium]|nr:starch-binding protein [Eubacteriales bacterium]
MKTKKHFALRVLSILLSLILLAAALPMAGILSASAGAEEGIYLRGSMNGWNCSEQYKFVPEGNNIYTLVVFMTGSQYEYKVGTPSWSIAFGAQNNNSANAVLDLDSDSIVKFTANLNTQKQSYEIMNTKSDFTFGTTAQTIEAENYTFALGAVTVLDSDTASKGKYVGDFDKGDSLNYGVTVTGDKAMTYRFTVSVASKSDDGAYNFVTGSDVTEADFTSTGAWQTYKSMVFTKTLNPGYNRITIENTAGTYNVDKITVEPAGEYSDTVIEDGANISFAGYDSISDTAIVKDGKLADAKAGEYVSLFVNPKTPGVYEVSLGSAQISDKQVLLGDADGDGKVNVKDATAIQKHAANLITITGDALISADCDRDGKVNVKDATAVQKFTAGIAVDSPIGEIITVSAGRTVSSPKAKIGTSREDMVSADTATLVIDGITEVFVEALADGLSVDALSFKYIPNVEKMGYTASIEDGVVTRFDTEFFVNQFGITANEDIDSLDILLSDGNRVNVTDIKANEKKVVGLGQDHNILWIIARSKAITSFEILGKKNTADKEKDIALEGYVSTHEGWQKAADYPYFELSAKEFGLGFDKEITLNKVSFVSTKEDVPTTVVVTTASGKTKELTGTTLTNAEQRVTTFDLGGLVSFGYFFEFEKDATVNMIMAEGDTTYAGASVNVSDALDYELFANGLTENDSRVIANTGTHILSSETGSDREWSLSYDISGSPSFYAPNTPLAEAAYNLTMEEIYKSINTDPTFGDVFYTGTNWQKVWTRDTAISMQYVLSWLFPEISTNCARAKVVGKDGHLTFEEDTGTGGSYPVSTDRMIMMLAVWETYLADGNKETLEYFYNVAKNTIEQDYEVVYDEASGLFRGETCGLDHRDKTYGDWTGEDDQNGIVNIAESKATSTNIIFCQAMKILSESATILGKGEAESKAWADLAAELEKAITERLWHEELGTYASWEYPEFMGSPLSYKQDVLGNGYAVWYNIGSEEMINSIMENYTLVNFGANTVYPQKNAQRWTDYKYHDSGVWPGWEAILMIGAANNDNENNLLAEEIWNSCIRGAVACLTNYEVIDYETGEGLHSTQQLWSIAATMAGYFRVLYGMEYTTDGITFDPYVPEWMEGPFTVTNYKYRDAVLNMHLIGKGDTVSKIYVNGVEKPADYVFPTDAKGEYTVEIHLEDSGAAHKINLKDANTAKAPNAPTAKLSGNKLSWNAISNCTYKVWTGNEYVDVQQNSYTVDTSKYGCYSVVAVDKTTGIWSELSKPISCNPTGSKITVNANNLVDNASNSKPLTVSVNVPVDGTYELSVIHTNQGDATAGITAAIRSVYVDGKEVGTLVFPAMNFANQISTHLTLSLTKGTHEITVKYDTANWYDRNMSQAHGQSQNNVTYKTVVLELTKGDFSGFGGGDTPTDTKTVYFTNNKGWSTVNAHYWIEGGEGTEWPGEQMSYVGLNEHNEQVYSITVDKSFPNIIFNNGAGQQTVNITSGVEDGVGFYLESNVSGKWTVGTYTYTAQ